MTLGEFIEALTGDSVEKVVSETRCVAEPIGCGQTLAGDTHFGHGQDGAEYEAEWKITGLCPQCQDRYEELVEV
ncbi:hypothetical protein [Streptomyces wuyuanensis]|uniref:hypothetical protein n=1 Tax=Streptomyces wuyuanensis TaxID=1196353 RepID=UPI0034242F9A